MRRPSLPLSLLLAAAMAALWVAALTGPASAAPRSAHIICPASPAASPPTCCPLPPGTQRAHVVCCPPAAAADAQPICCGSTPCCATGTNPCCTSTCCPSTGSPTCCTAPCGPGSLSIASSPNPSRAGQKVVISGAVVGSSTAGTQVVLWREPAGQSSFQQAGQTTTDSAGHYTFTLPAGSVMADEQWYVTAAGVKSAIVQQHVGAIVGLTSSARSIRAGRTIVLRGRVTPSHAGEVVLIEVSRGSTWHVIGRPRLARGSSYTLSRRFARPGTLKLRVVLSGDSRNDRSISRTVTVKVKP